MAYEFKLPDIGEGVVEGEIIRWLVREGEPVEEDQPLVEVMTDKATVEIPSPRKGWIAQRNGEEGEVVEVGATLVIIETEQPSTRQPSPGPARKDPPKERRRQRGDASPARQPGRDALATPAVRRLAREMKIDLSQVEGSGPGGRIQREDLVHAAQPGEQTGGTGTETPKVAAEQTVPYRGLRRKIGEHLVESKHTAPHYTYVEEVDVTELVRLRNELRQSYQTENVELSYLPFIIKAVVEGLKKYPLMNASLDLKTGVIRIHPHYHLGVATATPEGLLVPVVRDVDRKSLLELAREVAQLSEAARAGTLERDNLTGGTFTITSLGALGGLLATPIINYPEVAILGVHKMVQKPVVRNAEIVIRQMMNLSLSLDHRVVDGALAAAFVHHIIPFLENPQSLASLSP